MLDISNDETVMQVAWEKVEPLIRTHLGDLPIPVYVYSTYHHGVRANEPRA